MKKPQPDVLILPPDYLETGPSDPELVDHVARNMVCVEPQGFAMTQRKWDIIHAHWLANGRKFLEAEDVERLMTKSGEVDPVD